MQSVTNIWKVPVLVFGIGLSCQAPPTDHLVASVNRQEVTQAALHAEVDRVLAEQQLSREALPHGYEQKLRRRLARRLIEAELYRQEAEKLGIHISNDEAESVYQQRMQDSGVAGLATADLQLNASRYLRQRSTDPEVKLESHTSVQKTKIGWADDLDGVHPSAATGPSSKDGEGLIKDKQQGETDFGAMRALFRVQLLRERVEGKLIEKAEPTLQELRDFYQKSPHHFRQPAQAKLVTIQHSLGRRLSAAELLENREAQRWVNILASPQWEKELQRAQRKSKSTQVHYTEWVHAQHIPQLAGYVFQDAAAAHKGTPLWASVRAPGEVLGPVAVEQGWVMIRVLESLAGKQLSFEEALGAVRRSHQRRHRLKASKMLNQRLWTQAKIISHDQNAFAWE